MKNIITLEYAEGRVNDKNGRVIFATREHLISHLELDNAEKAAALCHILSTVVEEERSPPKSSKGRPVTPPDDPWDPNKIKMTQVVIDSKKKPPPPVEDKRKLVEDSRPRGLSVFDEPVAEARPRAKSVFDEPLDPEPVKPPPKAAPDDFFDMLGDGPVAAPKPPPKAAPDDFFDMLGDGPVAAPVVSRPVTPPKPTKLTVTAFEKNGVKITCTLDGTNVTPQGRFTDGTFTFTNCSEEPVSDFVFQAAVPKGAQIQLKVASGNSLEPNAFGGEGAPVTQTMKCMRPDGTPLKVMMRISYTYGGKTVQLQELADCFAGF